MSTPEITSGALVDEAVGGHGLMRWLMRRQLKQGDVCPQKGRQLKLARKTNNN